MNETAIVEMEMPQETENAELALPLDLKEWVPAAQLRDWIMTDVAALDWTNDDLMEYLRRHPEFEPKALLNTMTLAYVTGIFNAEEIARRCSSDIDFRGVRPKLPPIAAELKAFRKANRAIFKWVLARVITRALKTQLEEGEAIESLPVGLRRYVLDNAVERLELARHFDRSAEL
jgi:hypothetical protein